MSTTYTTITTAPSLKRTTIQTRSAGRCLSWRHVTWRTHAYCTDSWGLWSSDWLRVIGEGHLWYMTKLLLWWDSFWCWPRGLPFGLVLSPAINSRASALVVRENEDCLSNWCLCSQNLDRASVLVMKTNRLEGLSVASSLLSIISWPSLSAGESISCSYLYNLLSNTLHITGEQSFFYSMHGLWLDLWPLILRELCQSLQDCTRSQASLLTGFWSSHLAVLCFSEFVQPLARTARLSSCREKSVQGFARFIFVDWLNSSLLMHSIYFVCMAQLSFLMITFHLLCMIPKKNWMTRTIFSAWLCSSFLEWFSQPLYTYNTCLCGLTLRTSFDVISLPVLKCSDFCGFTQVVSVDLLTLYS